MHKPLLHLLFSEPSTPASVASSSFFMSATQPISRTIDLIISDLFIFSPVWEAYKRNITAYFFVPNNLMVFVRYINLAKTKIDNGELGLDFDRKLYQTIPRAKGLICNSVLELDQEALQQFHRQSKSGLNVSILFVAPLMPRDVGQKQHVRIESRAYEQILKCLTSDS